MTTRTVEETWSFELEQEFGHHDMTSELEDFVAASGITIGVVVVQLVGSTGAVTTIEYEPGALADLERAVSMLAPVDGHYEHNARWGDGNGFSHVRSALLKTSLSIPIVNARLALGTWQQVIVLNLDNRRRGRTVVAVAQGET